MKKVFLLFILGLSSFYLILPSSVLAINQTGAESSYQNAKNEFEQAVSAFRQARKDFINARNDLKTLRNGPKSREALDKAKNFLIKADFAAIKYLTMTRTKVEAAQALSEAEKQASLNEIDNDLNWLTAKQAEINAATTKEELVVLAFTVKNHWGKIRVDAKRITGRILAAKTSTLLNKLINAGNQVEEVIKNKKANGKNTSQLESWLNDYRQKVNTASQKYEAGKLKFNAISSLSDFNQLFNQGTAFIKEGNLYLREAQQELKKIIKELKKSS